jgi:hypothetical protein
MVAMLEDATGNSNLVILHGIHTSPAFGLHVTVQLNNTAAIGHIDLVWQPQPPSGFVVTNLDHFQWLANPHIAVNPNFIAHDVVKGADCGEGER